MPGIHRLTRSMKRVDVSKEDSIVEFNGILGIQFNGQQLVDVPNRDGYVYVRLRSNLNEVIQAYNSSVSPVYGLPVVVVRDKLFNRYSVKGRDLGRYEDWGSSSYLPRHGAQHSFSDDHYGGDIVWVHDRQFVPLSISPSGTMGALNVYVNGDVYYSNSEWIYAGNTGSPSFIPYKPTGSNARIVLVYLDANGNPQLEPGDYMDNSVTGVSQILPYLPDTPGNGTPLGAVRLLSGTSRITWSNIYDLRPIVAVQSDLLIQDEGATKPHRSYLNFKGQLVWAIDNAGADATDIIISGSTASGGHIIQDESVALPQRTKLNFIGGAVSVVDNPGNDRTDVTISSSSGTYTGTPDYLTAFNGAGNWIVDSYIYQAYNALWTSRQFSCADFIAKGNAKVSADLYVSGSASVDNTLSVDGQVSAASSLLVGSLVGSPASGDLHVTNDARIGGGLHVGSLLINPSDDDIEYDGDLEPHRSGTSYTAYPLVPLQTPLLCPTYNGSGTFSAGTYGIDAYNDFGAPDGPFVKAYLVYARCRWAATSGVSRLTFVTDVSATIDEQMISLRAHTLHLQEMQAIIPCDSNGDFAFLVFNADALDLCIKIFGYFI